MGAHPVGCRIHEAPASPLPENGRRRLGGNRTVPEPPGLLEHHQEARQILDHLLAGESAPGPLWPDPKRKPPPRSVLAFVLGDEGQKVQPKFVGSRGFVERCVVALATNRGLMLIGEPGTAKSYLSELLAAAVSRDSTLTIQGSAGTTEDNIKYSWNYALLLAEGPSTASLVPAPLHRGMSEGKVVRFEEITRCPLEMQDVLLSILSDRVMAVPELRGEDRSLFAVAGFNVM